MGGTTNIFLTGSTGYIGGTVLQRLLAHPERESFNISVLVRNAEKAKLLENFGVTTVVGSHSDLEKLEQAAASADVVFAIADCDDLKAATAILSGLKKRHAETGEQPILIHTSGTGVLADNAQGKYASDLVYSDLDIPLIETLKPTQPHRWVDIAIVEAGKQGYARTHIVLPGVIFGLGHGPLFETGICNQHSMELPTILQIGWHRGRAGIIGEGRNIWPLSHIDDTADLYIVLFDAARKRKDVACGREGFYFVENGHFSVYEATKAVGHVLVELGRAKTAEPTPFTPEELDKYFAGVQVLFMGTNSVCKAERSRALGWRPTKTKQDMLESIRPEADALIKNGRIEDAFHIRGLLAQYVDL
ncbi:NAD P-binding protein [Gloeophyllum trabeum ATCC 11539]|uniref:NAD P-binding protein n=1 Tax=Gloeophyllum trabeum (strain ATCC 11539 / FP-39264 / Madison 617) TaxID=670483 RepID=S7PY76_GLOTA|nr:NAD P-binding protein [Gloeophyllum trabeum ATCC 11539]EPQ52468.1 NAD P-binding protein [Gloeophyllum trabeum ATCC 11539]